MSSKVEDMTNQLLEAIKDSNPPLYDALIALGRHRLAAQGEAEAEAEAANHPKFGIKESRDGESVDVFLDRIVDEFQEKHDGANVVILDEDGNIVRDTRQQSATQAEVENTISCSVYTHEVNGLQYQGTFTMPCISYAAVEEMLSQFNGKFVSDYYTLAMTDLSDGEVSSAIASHRLCVDGSYKLEIEFDSSEFEDNWDADYDEEVSIEPIAIISTNDGDNVSQATFYTERSLEIFLENQ